MSDTVAPASHHVFVPTTSDFDIGMKKDDVVATVTDTEEDADPKRDGNIDIDVHTNLRDGVVRKMEQRHMQMIALAGVIGTGLFLGSGKAIAHGGPAGALLAYILMGTVVWSMRE